MLTGSRRPAATTMTRIAPSPRTRGNAAARAARAGSRRRIASDPIDRMASRAIEIPGSVRKTSRIVHPPAAGASDQRVLRVPAG
ncbi:MAG: hypothetical protein DMF55_10220 [Acidobacteria bacterium]|nr:MAG: hypothetical protein DMF55_10220 [Acidobacteriota bacterium]